MRRRIDFTVDAPPVGSGSEIPAPRIDVRERDGHEQPGSTTLRGQGTTFHFFLRGRVPGLRLALKRRPSSTDRFDSLSMDGTEEAMTIPGNVGGIRPIQGSPLHRARSPASGTSRRF